MHKHLTLGKIGARPYDHHARKCRKPCLFVRCRELPCTGSRTVLFSRRPGFAGSVLDDRHEQTSQKQVDCQTRL